MPDNFPAFTQAIQQHEAQMTTRMRRLVERVADDGVVLIRGRIPPNANRSAGMPYRFPGYAATGLLKSQYARSPVVRIGRTVRSRVGLNRSAPPLIRITARVHERGAVILPRRAPYLKFQINGQWISTRRSVIRPKRYFASAHDELRSRMRSYRL